MKTDWWREPSYKGIYVDASFSPSDIDEAKSLLDGTGIEYEVLIENVQEQISESFKTVHPSLKFTGSNDVDFD